MMAALYVAIVLTAALCIALGRAIGRRERPELHHHRLAKHVHGDVRGKVVDMRAWRDSAPKFRSARRR